MKNKRKTKREMLIGMSPCEHSLAGEQSGESGIGIFDIILESEDGTDAD